MLTRREFAHLGAFDAWHGRSCWPSPMRRGCHARGPDLQFPAADQTCGRRHVRRPRSGVYRVRPARLRAVVAACREPAKVAREDFRKWRLETPIEHFTPSEGNSTTRRSRFAHTTTASTTASPSPKSIAASKLRGPSAQGSSPRRARSRRRSGSCPSPRSTR